MFCHLICHGSLYLFSSEICGSHGHEYVVVVHTCGAVWTSRYIPTLRRIILSPSSALNTETVYTASQPGGKTSFSFCRWCLDILITSVMRRWQQADCVAQQRRRQPSSYPLPLQPGMSNSLCFLHWAYYSALNMYLSTFSDSLRLNLFLKYQYLFYIHKYNPQVTWSIVRSLCKAVYRASSFSACECQALAETAK